jgi:hypothetical protein
VELDAAAPLREHIQSLAASSGISLQAASRAELAQKYRRLTATQGG